MSRLATPIRKNDNVLVVTGKDRGKRGRVLKVVPDKNRLIVEGVNMIKRHTKPNPGKNIKGGIVEREASLHASNVQLVCPECGAQTRIGHKILGDGRKVRDLPQVRGSRRQMSRLKDKYQKEVVPALTQGVRLQERDGRAPGSRRSSSTWASARRRRTRRSSTPAPTSSRASPARSRSRAAPRSRSPRSRSARACRSRRW